MEVEVLKATSNNSQKSMKNATLNVAAYCRVSTDNEEQAKSYASQKQHYENMINENRNWTLVQIFADEAITGTTDKRESFQKMIGDAVKGKIDLIITKSISRFARNTLDTLSYVRKLKEHGVAVFFEEENINTLTMDGELLLTILSSVAQQEVENTSANVRKGLKMKMQRGEQVGTLTCLGFKLDEQKKMVIDEREAAIVRKIYELYLCGYSFRQVANYCMEQKWLNHLGKLSWSSNGIRKIIKNEKMCGDLLQQKSFTIDTMKKRRVENFGEEDKFYVRDHHDPIVSREVWDEAQRIVARRSQYKGTNTRPGRKYSGKYSFSSKVKCMCCGQYYTRRDSHPEKKVKPIWKCSTAARYNNAACPHSITIREIELEKMFCDVVNRLVSDENRVIDNVLSELKKISSNSTKRKTPVDSLKKQIEELKRQDEKLLELVLSEQLKGDIFKQKHNELNAKIKELTNQIIIESETSLNDNDVSKRINKCRKFIENHKGIQFERSVFQELVDVVEVNGEEKKITYKFAPFMGDVSTYCSLDTCRVNKKANYIRIPQTIVFPIRHQVLQYSKIRVDIFAEIPI